MVFKLLRFNFLKFKISSLCHFLLRKIFLCTHALRKRAELPLQKFKSKWAQDPSFSVRAVRCVVLEPPGDIRRSSLVWEIRRSSSARRDASFLNRPVRYDVLRPRGEIRSSSTAWWDTTFFSRAPRYDVLPLCRRYVVKISRDYLHLFFRKKLFLKKFAFGVAR